MARSAEGGVKPSGTALDAGLRLLGRRAHSRRELALKLARRGYEADAIGAALDRLTELGYLDDAAFALALVARRAAGRGGAAIGAELRAKGVSRDLAGLALAGLDEERQLSAARRLATRLVREGADAAARRRAAASLVRRGFSLEVAWTAVREAVAQDLGDNCVSPAPLGADGTVPKD